MCAKSWLAAWQYPWNNCSVRFGAYCVTFYWAQFDAKGEANHVLTDLGLPVTLLQTSVYWDNFIGFGMGPKKGPDGLLAFTMPMGDRMLPGIAGEHLTGAQMAAALTKALGNMFQFKRDFEHYFCGARNLEFSRSLNPELQTFATWLDRNKGRFPLE